MKLSDQIARAPLFVAFGSSQQTGGLSSVDLAATSDGSSVTLTASDGSAAPIAGADAGTAGVMTAADKAKLDALPPTRVRDFETFSEIAGAAVASAITHLRTAGRASAADGGGGLYGRVAAEPLHAGKVQSADGAWWELVPDENGRWTAEQFDAVNRGAANDHAALTDALFASVVTRNTLVAKGKYRIDSRLVFPNGTYGFEGPGIRQLTAATDAGFIWGGGNDDTGIEILDVESCVFSGALMVSNKERQATGFRGILFHNPDSSGSAISNCQFEMIGVYGANVGVQIGDFTNDGYDSNWEQNVIENLHFYDVANPLIIDSNNQDNIQIHMFHNGGPITLPAYVGTRNHAIHVKRNGNGLFLLHAFIRVDGITPDNAGVQVDDGSFHCGYLSFEGDVTAPLVNLNGTIGRDQSVLQKVVAPSHTKDSAGRSMRLGHRSGTVLIGCSVGGDIECSQPVMALGTVLLAGSEFTLAGSGRAVEFGTLRRLSDGDALDPDFLRLDLRTAELRRTEQFGVGPLNASGTASAIAIDNKSIAAGSVDVWQIAMEASNALNSLFRVFVWRNSSGAVSVKTIADLETSPGTIIAVTDNGNGTYDMTIENSAANNKFYSGWLASRDSFSI